MVVLALYPTLLIVVVVGLTVLAWLHIPLAEADSVIHPLLFALIGIVLTETAPLAVLLLN
jgi:hypothetical protein